MLSVLGKEITHKGKGYRNNITRDYYSPFAVLKPFIHYKSKFSPDFCTSIQ